MHDYTTSEPILLNEVVTFYALLSQLEWFFALSYNFSVSLLKKIGVVSWVLTGEICGTRLFLPFRQEK